MPRYMLFAAVEMEGVHELDPIKGVFNGAATAYFLQLWCTTCREATSKQICLYPGPSLCPFYLRSKKE
uniref:Uncharacterized protein n=1 Tax=Oryza sativa subsp. japonica TaxID=39947 RepID=Q654Z9_ORYSJ|nr:hypothetical protein [Oryza sativa Japonica Group]